jgi:hypothetical protein
MRNVAYGKIGRSMPLTLEKCANLGGDVEMVAVVKELALRHPDDKFWLIGRNTGEVPQDVGLPKNVVNPWNVWSKILLARKRELGLNKSNLTVQEHYDVQSIFDELTLPTIISMDAIVLWAGQHGTTNIPIPAVSDGNKLTKPHDWCAHYCGFLLRGVNTWRDADPLNREEVWLNADPRNYLKMRDLKWPMRNPVLTQFNFKHNIKHERYGDSARFDEFDAEALAYQNMGSFANVLDPHGQVWKSQVTNVYSRLEVNGLRPGMPFGNLISYDENPDRKSFGLFINEARRYVSTDTARRNILRDWILPLNPDWIHGTWNAESLAEIGYTGEPIKPAAWEDYYPRLHSVRTTFTTPSSGSGWATAKPWEAFAAGTACLFHPLYDIQDNILGDAPAGLREWLRVKTPAELRHRIEYLNSPEGTADWLWVVRAQREHFDNAMKELRYMRLIEDRIFK